VKDGCKIVESDTGSNNSAWFDLFCDGSHEGYIRTRKTKLGRRSVWVVGGLEVNKDRQRKGHATSLYAAAAAHACSKRGRLASTERLSGAFSNDFWEKQERKGRATRIRGAGEKIWHGTPLGVTGSGWRKSDAFVLDVCGPNIDLSGLPERMPMRTNLGDPLLASFLAPWLAAPIALMLLLKPATASAALTPTTTKFTRPPADILNALKVASGKTGVPLPILIGVAHTETRYNPALTSNKGAAGLMQLMPKTAESLGVTNRLDPAQSALGGAKLLKTLYSQYGNWDQALAAYNWGQGNVNKNPEPSQWIPRTRTYVANVQYVAKNV